MQQSLQLSDTDKASAKKGRIGSPGLAKLEAIAEAMGFSPALWFDKSDGHRAPDAALTALFQDETALEILGEVLRMPPKDRSLLLSIARQISPQGDG